MTALQRIFLVLPLLILAVIVTVAPAPGQNKQPAKAVSPAGPADAPPSWIWLGKTASSDQVVYFRKDITVKGRFNSVRLHGTCDNAMTVYVDGKEVASSSTWETPVFKDVTDAFVPREKPAAERKHVVAVRAKNAGGAAGLLIRLVFEQPAGGTSAVTTDEAWRASEKGDKGWNEVEFDDSKWVKATVVGKLGGAPWTAVTDAVLTRSARLREPEATPVEKLKVAKDFKVELLHSVPKDREGSWVNLCVDPKGRLIVSDQYGGLFRVTPPAPGKTISPEQIEKVPADIGEAQGMLWAFDSLYIVVNRGQKYESGLYRVRDTNGDDKLDEVKQLRKLNGGGEHGPHAVLLAPDGKSLYIVCGNGTKLAEISSSRVPRLWGEDHLLPRMPDGNGFMRDVLGPGGCIYRIDPDGKDWELISNGYRNQFDAAFNRHGELFTYDADMEWDMNTPWYRPTRINHVTSGSEYGWRNGAGKWPAYYADSLPAVVDIGPGSPTGVTFGYGAKFPAKYQEALFILDWSYGKLYAVHLRPDGSSYKGEFEEFISGSPLPLTDAVINPQDGAMYFAIGGRRTQSGLYRVTYAGKESTAPAPRDDSGAEQRALRHKLEALHARKGPEAVAAAWPYLGHADRFLRFAARVAIEHQDVASWRERALSEKDLQAALSALLALVRASAQDPFHRKPSDPSPDPALKGRILEALECLTWGRLTAPQQLDLLRVYAVLFNRLGTPSAEQRQRVIALLDPHYPSRNRLVNAELCQVLVYLEAPGVAEKTVRLLETAPTQEEQMEYARALRVLKSTWTPASRKAYLSWFIKAANYKGGNSLRGFMANMKRDAVATLTEAEKTEYKDILEAKPETAPVAVAPPRPFVKNWTLSELVPLVEAGLTKRDFDRGRTAFGQASCFACHRYDNEGGSFGPDLTGLAGRFSARDLLESIVEPNKVISDQYQAVVIETSDGRVVTGRIINLNGDSMMVNTNMLDPNALTTVNRKQIEQMKPSPISMMPRELLNTFTKDEVLDLMAYLLSRGDRNSPMFK